MSGPTALDFLLFAVLPYLSIVSCFGIGYLRYRTRPYTYSSLSSQFLENKQHFWGLMPFHYGIIVVLLGHLVAFLIPREIIAWNSKPVRLYVLEISALVFGLLALIGLVAGIVRRLSHAHLRRVTTWPDWILFLILTVQISTGIGVAVFHPWGSSWYATTAVPYLRSLLLMNPQIAALSVMPLLVKAHITCAFLLIGFFPFTRLVHVFSIPNSYLWRRPQVVRWYGRVPRTVQKGVGES
ncbi:MAG TPA: respiratory nitrate reductase subunit gamma [Acidobacteriota bacterium]|jgi:nitrate reductase gamma subunit|nr:respiratory nitrate reductase subunit gamma [Acidobacteriota bacterium]